MLTFVEKLVCIKFSRPKNKHNNQLNENKEFGADFSCASFYYQYIEVNKRSRGNLNVKNARALDFIKNQDIYCPQ